MTINTMRASFSVKSSYIGTGNQDTYSFNFKIINKEQLLVVHADENDTVIFAARGDDTVNIPSVVFDEDGGTITLAADLPIGHKLVILFADDEPLQPQKFANSQNFKLKQLENALDRLTGPLQKLFYRTGERMVRISDEYTGDFDGSEGLRPTLGGVIGFTDDGTNFKSYEVSEFIGPQGPSGTMQVGTVTVVDYDDPTPMGITNVGSAEAAILDFILKVGPQGEKGEPGDATGIPGPKGDPGKDGQIRYTGHGPPGIIVGANPNDTYLDLDTGDIYKLT